MNQGDKDYFKNRENHGFSHLNAYNPNIIIPRVKIIMKETKIRPGYFVLDFGCAKGFYLKGFEEEGVSVIGYDISEYAITVANEFLKREVAFANFEKIETLASKKRFDLVLMKDTAEHIAEPILSIMFRRLAKIAKKVLVIVPVIEKNGKTCPDRYRDPTHINMQSDYYWREYLGNYGSVQELPTLTQKLKKEYSNICCSFIINFKIFGETN